MTMTDVATKTCRKCGAEHPATNEFFGTDKSEKDSLRRICKKCYADSRSGKTQTKEAQRLKIHRKIVADAKRRLANPENLTPGELSKLEVIVRLESERLEKLQAKVTEQREQAERTRVAVAGSNALTRVQAMGSALFLGDGTLLPVSDRAKQLDKFKAVLAYLTEEPANEAARVYLQTNIQLLEQMMTNASERATFIAEDAQEKLNERVSRRVVGRFMDIFLPQIRAAVTAEAKISLREQIRDRKKKLMAMAKTATGKDSSGAEKAVVATTVADALEKLAGMLYHGTKAPLPTDTLANIESRQDAANATQEWLETEEAKRQAYWQELKERDPKQFERESKSLLLQIRGDGPLADMQRKSMAQLKRENPAEYERRALEALKPRKVVPDTVIWVVMEGTREVWMWPDGRLVKKGEEVTYDARTKRFCLMPGPAGVELDSPGMTHQRMELNQHDDGTFHWEPEGSQGTWHQKNDGSWEKDAGSGVSPWTKQERIQFRRAESPASDAHIHFRHGKWFTQAEVDEAARIDAANPPQLLPPLPKYAVADSLALPPATTAADRLKDAKPLETAWGRHERLMREAKAREAELLRN
jgi:ribosomal protein L40E